jgi:hypothetical protein
MPDKAYLKWLAAVLEQTASSSSLSQQAIEAATGVDQTTISRAKNGKLKRVTEKVRRIGDYALMRQREIEISREVREAATIFLTAGGLEAELLAFIRNATRLLQRRAPTDPAA